MSDALVLPSGERLVIVTDTAEVLRAPGRGEDPSALMREYRDEVVLA